MEGQHLGNINPETQDELKKFFKRSPVEYDPSYDYNLDYGDSEPQLSIAMANRSKLDYGMVMPRDTKTLRTLCNIFIYSAVKLDIPKSESLGSFSFRDREAAEKAKEEVDAAGLNGVQGLSWRSRMVVLRSIFAGEDAEDVWPRVYEHGKGVAEWMRGPLSEGTNRYEAKTVRDVYISYTFLRHSISSILNTLIIFIVAEIMIPSGRWGMRWRCCCTSQPCRSSTIPTWRHRRTVGFSIMIRMSAANACTTE